MKRADKSARRVSSIARKINRAWVWRLFRVFLALDLFIALLLAFHFCRDAEVNALGDFSWSRARSFDLVKQDEHISGVDYRFFGEDGAVYVAPLADAFAAEQPLLTAILWAQLGMLIWQRLFGAGMAKRQLKPLDKLAAQTQQLTEAPKRADLADDAHIHNLEDAIGALSPARPDAELHIDNRELAGLETAINNLLRRMREALSEQTRFVSDASHELRTPISVIQGYASMLDRWGKRDEDVLEESIHAIKAESEHMSVLVEQLLFLARGDSGRQTLELASVSLTEMMREVFEESQMIDARHDWRLDVGRDEAICTGDVGMLKQAARILTDNAAKYTPEGGAITLRAFTRGDRVCFEVQDTGRGVDAEALPRIFDRFYRADASRSGQSGGTGLGLSIAKWIVERHHGYFDVLSRVGVGTRITVSLPKAESEDATPTP